MCLNVPSTGTALLVDRLEVWSTTGDDLLTGDRSDSAPRDVGDGHHITNDGPMFSFEGAPGAGQETAGVYIAEPAIDSHTVLLRFPHTSRRTQTALALISY